MAGGSCHVYVLLEVIMRRTGFALYAPSLGWWAGLDPVTAADRWSDTLVNACVMGSENTALEYGVALDERHNGLGFWVYEVHFVRRQFGRRW